MKPTNKPLLTGVFIWLMASCLLQGQSMVIASVGKGQAFKLTGGRKYKNYTIQLCGGGAIDQQISKSCAILKNRIKIEYFRIISYHNSIK